MAHLRFSTERSGNIPVVPQGLGAPFVFECEALLSAPGAYRHHRIVVLCESKPGQFILGADLRWTYPPDKYPCPKHTQMNLVEPDRMSDTPLSFLPVEPVMADQAVFPHALQQNRSPTRDGIHKLTRAIWRCLPPNKFAVHQSS